MKKKKDSKKKDENPFADLLRQKQSKGGQGFGNMQKPQPPQKQRFFGRKGVM